MVHGPSTCSKLATASGSTPGRAASDQAERVLRELGLSATEAITLFYTQVVLRQGVPFEVSIPNAATVEALREAREPDEATEHSSLDELKAAL